jgi:uncharacterized membrane protein YraQ (UPF0718 family)
MKETNIYFLIGVIIGIIIGLCYGIAFGATHSESIKLNTSIPSPAPIHTNSTITCTSWIGDDGEVMQRCER